MKKRKVIGSVMLGIIPVAVFALGAVLMGVREISLLFGMVIFLVIWIALGVHLRR